jgi:hypothetical protein
MNIRMEIESKFHQSKTNSQYKFPRTTKNMNNGKNFSVNSFESAKKKLLHRSSKSTLYPYLETRVPETFTARQLKTSKNHKSPKSSQKKRPVHIRMFSNRTLLKNQSPDSKSPAQKKSFIGIYSKNPLQTLNPGISEILNRVSGNRLKNPVLVRTESMRLGRVYRNLKTNRMV